MKQVKLYTDGACSHNPGPGGYGVVLMYDAHRKELSGGFRRTTNNRMEILAAIVGLESLKEPCQVTLYSDSQYLVDSIMKGWAIRWQAKGWMRNSKDKAINPDLWERLLQLCKIHKVQFEWVRGHAGHKENERCDELATAAVQGSALAVDEFYEQTSL
jgi:ribonuclease HI